MFSLRHGAGALLLLLALRVSAVAAPMAEPAIVSTPSPDRATIVFMRPSSVGVLIHAPIMDVTSAAPVMLGRVGLQEKMAVDVTPGQHRFMVLGNTPDFLDADVRGGKVYYVLVTPHQGAARPHFVFEPITHAITPLAFSGDQAETSWVAARDDWSMKWGQDHLTSLQSKATQAMPGWHGEVKLVPDDAR